MKPDEPDAHLRAALRHAPDAAVQAPRDLSAQIVAAAHRAAVEPAAPAARARRPAWPWGGTWRLGASGALASVLMAGVIGLLWREEPPGPAVEQPAPAAALPLPAPAPTLPPAAPPEPVPEPAAPRVRSVPAQATQAMAAPPAAPQPEPQLARGQVQIEASAQRPPLAMDGLPAAAPAAKLATQQGPSPATTLGLSGSRIGAGGTSDQLEAGGRSPALAPAASTLSLAPQVPVPWSAALAGGAAPALQQGKPGAADVDWQRTLLRLTAGRWQADATAQPPASEPMMEWRQADRLMGRLWLGESQALWCPAPGARAPCQVAPLSPQAATELKEKLPR